MNKFDSMTPEEAIKFINQDKEDWQILKNEKDFIIKKQKSRNDDYRASYLYYKAKFNIPSEKLALMMQEIELISEWEESFKEIELIEQETENQDVMYAMIPTPVVTADRDIVIRRRIFEDIDGYDQIIIATSTDHPEAPEVSGRVRATIHLLISIMRKISEEESEITFMTRSDPNGMIPMWVIEQHVGRYPAIQVNALKKKYPEFEKEEAFDEYL